MLRTIFILIIFLLFAITGVWLKQHDFVISGEYQGYLIETSAARLLIIVTLFTFVFYGIVKLFSWIINAPARISGKREKSRNEEGLKNLMKGFSALAAGDISYAEKLSNRAEKSLPNQPLTKLLKAQIAVIDNKPIEAEKFYSELKSHEDSKFIGYRGLISQAIENKELDRALELAEELLTLNSKSEWLSKSVIDLSFRNLNWDKAEQYTIKARKSNAITKTEAKKNEGLILFLKAQEIASTKPEDAISKLELSLKKYPDFIPSATLLAELLIRQEKYKKAISLIKKQWKLAPHPSLAEAFNKIYEELEPEEKLKKIKQLYNSNKEAIESQLELAKAYIAVGDKDKAKELLDKAKEMKETKSLCKIYAKIDNSIDWNKRAENAELDKCWYCEQTETIYKDWQLYSNAGHFDSIIWGYPRKFSDFGISKIKNDDNFLLIK